MDSVQLSLGICFTNEEWEKSYRLEEFVALAAAKASKPAPGLRLAEKRLRESQVRRLDSPIKFGLFLLPLLLGAARTSQFALRMILSIAYVGAVGGIVLASWREYSYARSLVSRIRRSVLTEPRA